jgi:hypothetical protein
MKKPRTGGTGLLRSPLLHSSLDSEGNPRKMNFLSRGPLSLLLKNYGLYDMIGNVWDAGYPQPIDTSTCHVGLR